MNDKRAGRGSQIEVPNLRMDEGKCLFGGYQSFILTATTVQPKSKELKYDSLWKALKKIGMANKIVYDVGCNNGIAAYIAASMGAKAVIALDHDVDCLSAIAAANRHLGITTVRPSKYSFGQRIPVADVTIALALIHWVYSCTSNFGSLERIIGYFKSITKKILIVEWVNPNDGAIQSFNHLDFNSGIEKEAYTEENFVNAINAHKGTVLAKLPTEKNTRTIYVITF